MWCHNKCVGEKKHNYNPQWYRLTIFNHRSLNPKFRKCQTGSCWISMCYCTLQIGVTQNHHFFNKSTFLFIVYFIKACICSYSNRHENTRKFPDFTNDSFLCLYNTYRCHTKPPCNHSPSLIHEKEIKMHLVFRWFLDVFI